MKPQCIKAEKIPLSIYVHLPWCKKKCPYCDFNSHEIKQSIPEKEYCEALLKIFLAFFQKLEKERLKLFFLEVVHLIYSLQNLLKKLFPILEITSI